MRRDRAPLLVTHQLREDRQVLVPQGRARPEVVPAAVQLDVFGEPDLPTQSAKVLLDAVAMVGSPESVGENELRPGLAATGSMSAICPAAGRHCVLSAMSLLRLHRPRPIGPGAARRCLMRRVLAKDSCGADGPSTRHP